MIDKRIGKRVKQARERLGITQEDLAEKTGLTTNYISTVERDVISALREVDYFAQWLGDIR